MFYQKIQNDVNEKNKAYVQTIFDKLIENLKGDDTDNSLNFIWEFVDVEDEKTKEYFDDWENQLRNAPWWNIVEVERFI